MDINESSQERIQDVFTKHYHDSSDSPISRDEFIHAGWSQQIYLNYYRLSRMLYFSYMNYWHYLESSDLCENAHSVLDDACENMEMFFRTAAGITFCANDFLSFVKDAFSPEVDGAKDFAISQQFVSLIEAFVGKQLSSVETSDNVRTLFSNYYQSNSKNYIEPRPTISKKAFISAGWTPIIYQKYYSLSSNLYYISMICKDLCARSRIPLMHKAQKMFSSAWKDFSGFIQDQLHFTLMETKELKYILNDYSGIVWCHPYDDIETYGDNRFENLTFSITYKQFLSWLEYEIGNQVVNAPPESKEPLFDMSPRKAPVDAPWYKLPYSELEKYRLQNTWPDREKAREALLQFGDFNSIEGVEHFWTLIFEFIKKDCCDNDVIDRMEEYENGDFDLYGDVLYIYKGETKCFREHHDIDSVTATVYDRRGGTVDINVNCCCDCHKYFISESEFFHYRELYGIVCGLKVDRHSTGYAKFPMAEYSILRLYGYNVGKEDNLSDEERQNLLKILVENEYVKKPEIIKYLEMFIRMNQGRPEMADSVSKWSADLAYIRELGIEKQPKVLLGKIEYAR